MRQARSGSRGLRIPATFRPQGLITLSTASSLAGLVGFVSCRQRLWGSTLRSFLLPDGHTTFLPCRPRMSLPRIRARRSKPTRANPEPDYRVLPPDNPLRRDRCLVRHAAGDSLGLCPFQGISRCRLDGCLHPSPLPRLSTKQVTPLRVIAPQSIDRRPLSPAQRTGHPS